MDSTIEGLQTLGVQILRVSPLVGHIRVRAPGTVLRDILDEHS